MVSLVICAGRSGAPNNMTTGTTSVVHKIHCHRHKIGLGNKSNRCGNHARRLPKGTGIVVLNILDSSAKSAPCFYCPINRGCDCKRQWKIYSAKGYLDWGSRYVIGIATCYTFPLMPFSAIHNLNVSAGFLKAAEMFKMVTTTSVEPLK